MTLNDAPTLISFGEVLWDIIDGRPYLGGAPFNLAAHAARLGMNARMISCVGDDDLGRVAIVEAAKLGVDMTGVMCGEHATGSVTVSLSDVGQPSYTIHEPAAWDFIELPSDIRRAPSTLKVDAVCFGTLAQRSPISQSALHDLLEALPDAPTFYDVNLRQEFYSKEIIEWGLHQANIVKVNDTEAIFLSRILFGREMSERQFANLLRSAYSMDVVLVTLGARGCLAADDTGVTHIQGRNITVRDAVGAGDAFSAAFLATWLRGGSAAEAASYGNVLGAYVATRNGAVPDYTDEIRMQIKSFGGKKFAPFVSGVVRAHAAS
ncbi:MAG: carbohydrate kinase [Capsulimonas sp.]|uniref:carbohydrate kinase family protein n=1 Tax=Capsulimonas sp. TaxID=2494211 RepID=UPI003267B89E